MLCQILAAMRLLWAKNRLPIIEDCIILTLNFENTWSELGNRVFGRYWINEIKFWFNDSPNETNFVKKFEINVENFKNNVENFENNVENFGFFSNHTNPLKTFPFPLKTPSNYQEIDWFSPLTGACFTKQNKSITKQRRQCENFISSYSIPSLQSRIS